MENNMRNSVRSNMRNTEGDHQNSNGEKTGREKLVSTFSIVGFDPATGELGIAVQSKFLAVGAVVPWAKAGVGAVATQSLANTAYGPEGLRLLAEGNTPTGVVEILTGSDRDSSLRQVGIVDARGRSATFTGEECFDWAGGIAGKNYAAQGNILVGEETVRAMAGHFQQSRGSLAERLVASLMKGQEAGGDSRGRQSAALLVVKEEGGYGGFNDRYIDLRVDDHPQPIKELKRLLDIFYLYFGEGRAESVKIKAELARELKEGLKTLGLYQGELDAQFDEGLAQALTRFYHRENFEEREQQEGYIDDDILNYLRGKVKQAGDV